MRNSSVLIYFLLVLFSSFTYAQSGNDNSLDKLIDQAQKTNSEALILYRDTEIVIEKYFGLGQRDTLIETMSCTKSIVSLAIIAMLEDGLIDSLETPVYKIYPEWNQGLKKQITINHLLGMTSGLQNVPNASMEIYPSPDVVKLALAAELDDKPGETFSYNNKAINLLAGISEKITGKRLDLYIENRIFKPLEINHYKWMLDTANNPYVMAGCQLKPIDFLKIGILILNKGIYKGRQVLSKASIEEILSPVDQYKGYGRLWWLNYPSSRYVVDNEIISGLVAADASEEFIQLYTKLLGSYKDYDEFENNALLILGDNFRKRFNEQVGQRTSMYKRTFLGQPIAYNANGYLGNYLVIVPKTKTVAVRMISHKSYDWDAGMSNTFADFKEIIIGLN